MKKLIGLSLLVGLGLALSTNAQAASGVRGSKTSVMTFNNIGPIGVSTGPAVLYSVIIGTGAVTDFVALFDSGSANGLLATSQLATVGFKMRIYASSTTQATQVSFDPPLQFNNGIMAANATTLISSLVVFEKGRAIGQGY